MVVAVWFALILVTIAGGQAHAQTLSSVAPSVVLAGSTGITFTVTGAGFTSTSVVNVNGTVFPATLVSGTSLTVAVPDSLFTTPAVLSIQVVNSTTAVSNVISVTVTNLQPPVIASIAPMKGIQGSSVPVTLLGSNLLGATVTIAGAGLSSTVTASYETSLFFTVAIAATASPGIRSVTVTNAFGNTSTLSGSGAPSLFEIDVAPPPPDIGTVTPTGALPGGAVFPSAGFTTTILQDGRVLVAGGNTTNAYLYDPSSNKWSATGPMSFPRTGHIATLLPDGRVLVAAGTVYDVPTTSMEIYDPSSGTWSAAGLLNGFTPPQFAQLLPDGHVQIGAYQPSATDPARSFAVSQIYNPFTGQAVASSGPDAAPFNVPGVSTGILPATPQFAGSPGETSAAGFLLADGRLLDDFVFQVICTLPVRPFGGECPLSIAYIFDQTLKTFTQLGTANPPWLLLSDDRILSSDGLLDPKSGVVSASVSKPAGKAQAWPVPGTNTLLPDGRVLFVNPGSTAQVFTPPGLQNRTASVSSATLTPLEISGWSRVEVNGNNFAACAAVTLNGLRLVTIYTGPQKLYAFVPPSLAAAASTGSFSVVNLTASYSVVTPVPPPVISSIAPASGSVGTTVNAMVAGSNLSGATAVTFDQSGVSATIQSGGTATQLPITITITAGAALGARSVSVTTSGGSFTVSNAFTVHGQGTTPVTPPQVIPEVEQGSIKVGYALVTPDPGSASPLATVTYGMVQNGAVQSQAGVLPIPLTTDTSIYVNVVPGLGRNLGIAVTNPGASGNVLTLTLKDSSGSQSAPVTINLQPYDQLARFVGELFGPDVIGAGFVGSMRVQGTAPFSILGLVFSGAEFSTLAVQMGADVAGTPSRTMSAGTITNTPAAGSVGGANAIIVPQFAMGGGWATQFALVNSTTATLSGRIDIFDALGNPLAVKLNGTTQSTFQYSILPGGTVVIAPRDQNGQSPF